MFLTSSNSRNFFGVDIVRNDLSICIAKLQEVRKDKRERLMWKQARTQGLHMKG